MPQSNICMLNQNRDGGQTQLLSGKGPGSRDNKINRSEMSGMHKGYFNNVKQFVYFDAAAP